MRLNILLGIFVGICIVCVHCISDSNNEENSNAEGNNKPLVKYACERTKLQVVCPRGKVINIIQANYGRFKDLAKCNPKKDKKFNTKCKSSKSLTVMRQRCHLKRECSVDATNAVFGDPCVTTIKYLEIRYRCVAEVTTTKNPPKKITPKKVTTKIPPKKTTPRATSPKKVVTPRIPPKKTTPRATTPKIVTPKIPPKKTTPKKVVTPKIPPIKTTSRATSPKKVVTPKIPLIKTTPRATTPKKVTPKIPLIKTTPRATTPKKVTPKIPLIKTTQRTTTLKKVASPKVPPIKTTVRATTPKITPKIPPIKTTPRATTPKTATKILPKRTTPRATTPKSKETTIKLTTERPRPKITTKTLATFTTRMPTPKVSTETTTKLTTEKLTPKVMTETTAKSTTVKPTPEVSTFEDTTIREVTTVGNRQLRKLACEHETLHIECEVGKVIRVLGANYGRTSTEVCSHQNISKHWNINCVYDKTETIMRKMCDGKKNCNVAAENSVFTDSCQNTLKYLEVNYLCEDEIATLPPTTKNLDIESSVTTTEIPKTTQEIPPSTTVKCLTEVLTTISTKSPVTFSEVPVTEKLLVTASDDDVKTTSEATTSPTTEAPPVPSTTKDIPILSTPKPQVTAPETSSKPPVTVPETSSKPPVTVPETSSKPPVTVPETSSKPRVTAPETSCSEEDLDCIIEDLGKRPDWFICEKDVASYPHPASNKLFIFCLNWKPFVKKCGQDRVFSEKLMTCINP